MIKREYNYEPLNKGIYGGLLSYPFDTMDITNDVNGKAIQIDYYQNSIGEADSRMCMQLFITRDSNGYVTRLEVKDLITVSES